MQRQRQLPPPSPPSFLEMYSAMQANSKKMPTRAWTARRARMARCRAQTLATGVAPSTQRTKSRNRPSGITISLAAPRTLQRWPNAQRTARERLHLPAAAAAKISPAKSAQPARTTQFVKTARTRLLLPKTRRSAGACLAMWFAPRAQSTPDSARRAPTTSS